MRNDLTAPLGTSTPLVLRTASVRSEQRGRRGDHPDDLTLEDLHARPVRDGAAPWLNNTTRTDVARETTDED